MKPLVDPILRSGALVALALAGGCAHVWVDAEGQRHFLGLMHLTLPPAQRPVATGSSILSFEVVERVDPPSA